MLRVTRKVYEISVFYPGRRNEGIMMSSHRKLFPLVLLLLLSSVAAAQTYRAYLRGTVYDQNGAAIPGAQIHLTNVATGDSRTTVSSSEGQYAISSLQPGVYRIEVEMRSFRKHSERIEVLVNQEQRLDITLVVAGPDEGGIDSVYEPMVKKDSASLGTVIENRQVVGLPLDGRNFYELSLLVPGAVPPAQGSAGLRQGGFGFMVHGARGDGNQLLLDGAFRSESIQSTSLWSRKTRRRSAPSLKTARLSVCRSTGETFTS